MTIINDSNLDILKEVCNIASGNALKSLIDLTGLNLDIQVPDVRLADFRDLPAIFGSEDKMIAAISQETQGDINASLFIGFDSSSVEILLSNMSKKLEVFNKDDVKFFDLTDDHLSMVNEVGSILTGSYISAIADFIKSRTSLSAPTIAIDMAGAILSQVLCTTVNSDERVLLIGTNLCVDGAVINAKIVLLPKEGALEFLLDSVKKQYVEV